MLKKIALFITCQLIALIPAISTWTAANDNFTQADWVEGLSLDNAVHPDNQSNWAKYSLREANISSASAGKLIMTKASGQIKDDLDTDFTGEKTNVVISGSGSAAKLRLSANISNPFESDSGKWMNLPHLPYIDYATAYVKAGEYVYSIWAGTSSRAVFARWDINNSKWVFLNDFPVPVARGWNQGLALCYSGTGDYIYVLRGQGTKDFYRYTISTDTWAKMKDIPQFVGVGGCLASKDAGKIYAVTGMDNSYFYMYNAATNNWQQKTNLPWGTHSGCSLVYPASGDFMYMVRGANDTRFAKYSITNDSWTDMTSTVPTPYSMYVNGTFVYPGSGNYIYGFPRDGWEFIRYNFVSNSWEKSPDNLPRLPVPNNYGSSYFYYTGGTNPKINWLSGWNYSRAFTFDINSSKWDEPSSYWTLPVNYGGTLTYDGSAYLYFSRSCSNAFGRYNIAQNKWEDLPVLPFSAATKTSGGIFYLSGYVYAIARDNGQQFARYSVASNAWETLASTPGTLGCGALLSGYRSGNKDYIYAFRGNDGASTFWLYDVSAGTWSSKANIPVGDVYRGAALLYPGSGNYMYAVSRGSQNRFYRYNMSPDTWTEMASLPFYYRPWETDTLVNKVGDSAYLYFVSGGCCSRGSHFFARYSVADNSWQWLDPPPTSFTAAVATSTAIYAMSDVNYALWKYDFATNQWTTPEQATESRLGIAGGNILYVPSNDTAYVLTATTNTSQYRYLCKYSLSGRKWLGFQQLPFHTGASTQAVYPGTGNYIYIFEGRKTQYLWRFDITAETFTKMENSIYKIGKGASACALGNEIYVTQGDDQRRVMVYYIDSDSWDVLPDAPNTVTAQTNGANTLVKAGDYLYLARAGTSKEFWRFDMLDGSWSSMADLPIEFSDLSCVFYPGTGDYIFAAYNNGFYRYSIPLNSWTESAKVPRFGAGFTMFYPGTGDLLYALPGNERLDIMRYSISLNQWDQPYEFMGTVANPGYSAATVALSDGDTLLYRPGGNSNVLKKYSLATAAINSCANFPVNVDEWSSRMTTDGKTFVYSTRGRSRYDFWQYNVFQDAWTTLQNPPATFLTGHDICYKNNAVYALRGESVTFWKYDLNSWAWEQKANLPGVVSWGGRLIAGDGNYIYCVRGNGGNEFYRYNTASNTWDTMASLPLRVAYNGNDGSALCYPGFDSIYYIPGTNWSTSEAPRNIVLRYVISTNAWEEIEPLPGPARSDFDFVYPGSGQYLYANMGYGDPEIWRYYLAFADGVYTSPIKDAGNNASFGTVTWTDNGLGQMQVKVRSSDSPTMEGATSWDACPVVTKGSNLVDYASLTAGHQYVQYQVTFRTDDLVNKIPELDNLTINYDYYSRQQELVSSAYNSTYFNNRLMKLSWSESQPAGTDVRLQLRTAPDNNGVPGAWGQWFGPTGTQSYTDNYSVVGDYSYAPQIEIVDGVARLMKILQDFSYAQRIVLDNTANAITFADYVVTINITSANKDFWEHVKSDGSDIRFADSEGTLLTFNFQTNGGSFDYSNKIANILVKIPSILANSKVTIFLKYGKADAVSASDSSLVTYIKFGQSGVFDGENFEYQPKFTLQDNDSTVYTRTNQNNFCNNYLRYKPLYKREVGKTFYFRAKRSSETTCCPYMSIGFMKESETRYEHCRYLYSMQMRHDSIRVWTNGTDMGAKAGAPVIDTWYDFKIVLKAAGAIYYWRPTGSPDWTKIYETDTGNDSNLRICMSTHRPDHPAYVKDWFVGMDGSPYVSGGSGGDILKQSFYSLEENTTSPSLAGWDKRLMVRIDNTNGGKLTNYQLKLQMDRSQESFWAACKTDGSDIRLVDSDNASVLFHQLTAFDYAGKTGLLWVKVPQIAAGEVRTIYLYYGRQDAADVSSFDNSMTKSYQEVDRNISGVSLDGSGIITIADSPTLNPQDNLTLEAMVNYTADTWLPGFGYRKKITFDNTAGSARSNIIAQFNVPYVTSKMKADYSDLRFVDTDGVRLRSQIKSFDASSATVLVLIPQILGSSTKDIYLYYGNSLATYASDSVYVSQDDFAALSDSRYVYARAFFESGQVRLWGNNDWISSYLTDKNSYTRDYGQTFEASIKQETSNQATMIGWKNNTTDPNYTQLLYAIYFENNGSIYIYENGTSRGRVSTAYTYNTWYDIRIVLKPTAGADYYYRQTGTQDWILLYSSTYSSATGLIPHVTHHGRGTVSAYIDNWQVYSDWAILSPNISGESAQPAINRAIISKSGEYELKFTQAGLSARVNDTTVSTPMYEAGRFMNAAMSYDGSKLRIFVDGVERNSASLAGAINRNANAVLVGQNLKGAIDEVRLWNRARLQSEINTDKFRGLSAAAQSGLVMYLRCDENSGTSALDSTSNANNGTLSGGAIWLVCPYVYNNEEPNVFYNFDGGAGTSITDNSGNGNTLTGYNTTWSSTDLTGFSNNFSINLNGTSAYLTAPTSVTNSLTGSISLEAWIRPQAVTGTQTIIDKGSDSGNSRNYAMYLNTNKLCFSFYNGGWRTYTSPSVISALNTYHVVVLYNAANKIVKMYVNGQEKYSMGETLGLIAGTTPLLIGKSVSGNYFGGLIDDVRVYNRVLSGEEILAHYEKRIYSEFPPSGYYDYEPDIAPEINAYAKNNPVVQPVIGVFYNNNLAEFAEIKNKPLGTEIKYQVSYDGYKWYWHNGSAWAEVSGGYSQSNTAAEVNAYLQDFQDTVASEGDFYYRAYMHSDESSFNTPSLENIAITLKTGETYYVVPAGTTAINSIHSDAQNDQWMQYKVILYSEGRSTPILDEVSLEYIKAYVTVNSPNGGEVYDVNQQVTITWDSQAIAGATGKVKLEYSADGGNTYKLIAAHADNTGTYAWTLPDDPSQQALVKVSSEDFPAVYDVSDAIFKILSVRITSPNGGEIWEVGKSHNVTWVTNGTVSANLNLVYSKDGGTTWLNIATQVPNTGRKTWTIPANTSDNVLIKITDASNANVTDISDAAFAIVPVPAITITSPTGGEQWKSGLQQNISWQTNQSNMSQNLILEYSNDDFVADIHTIETNVGIGTAQGVGINSDITGTYAWTVPTSVSDTVRVRVKESSIPSGRDTQDAVSGKSNVFAIVLPTITVSAPAGGAIWVSGDTKTLNWSTEGLVSSDLLLEYSIDGTAWQQIATGEANDGSYDWLIPSQAISEVVYLRISDNTWTDVKGVSAVFKVLPYPKVEVTQPNGGETLIIGADYSIKWQSWGNKLQEGGADYYKIALYYSADNGAHWTLIADEQANDGEYVWTVADVETLDCLVKVVDASDTLITDSSDEVFIIEQPRINITAPNGGEVWFATGNYQVTWTSEGGVSNNLKMEYSRDNGVTWNLIATGEANDGTYTWTVGDVNTNTALLRVTDASRPAVNDISDAVFYINFPEITVVGPNGGEEWVVGTEEKIIWSSTGKDYGAIRDNLTLQYSTNGGTTWKAIATGVQNSGEYIWTVPDDVSINCKVRVFDATRTATTDTSNAAFKICTPYVKVLTPNGGESWVAGTEHEITWKSVGSVSDNLKLEYSKDNFVTAQVIASNEANDASYLWVIPDNVSNSVKLRIVDMNRSEIQDSSDTVFSILSPVIKVVRPNGGELFTAGDLEVVQWENTGCVGSTLKLEYSKDNFLTAGVLIDANVANADPYTYNWTIPSDVSSTVRLRITDTTRVGVSDKSDAEFSIMPIPVLTVISPNGGESWRVGTEQLITWSDNGGLISNNLTLQYSVNGLTGPWKEIATGVVNDKEYIWTVPDDESTNCLIKIFDASRPSTQDMSNQVFIIQPPAITITSPNGGEVWAVDDRALITWTTEGTVSDRLILEWSPDNGASWDLIESSVPNSGSYSWIIPDVSAAALVRIKDALRPATVDVSDAPFTVKPMPTITVIGPNGGETYVLGENATITWSWTGLSVANVSIDCSNDNFVSSRRVIVASTPNNGTYTWQIPNDALTGSTLKVRISDASRTTINDMSDGYFRIRGGFTLLTPNGSENWGAKSPQTISWNTRGSIPKVKLEYSSDSGINWNLIAADVTNGGSYLWTLPDIKSTTVKVRVADPDDSSVSDESDNVFNVVYFTVKFNIFDYDTLQHLSDLTVNEPATGWSDTGVNSPLTRTQAYPYGSYTTFFSKSEFIDSSVTWSPPKQGTEIYVVNLSMESAASAQVTWDAVMTYSYSPADDSLSAVASLQRKGKLVGLTDVERADMGPATLTIYQSDGTSVRNTLVSSAPNPSGMYTFSLNDTKFEVGKVYPATLSIEFRNRPYVSTANIDVGAEKLQYEFFTKTAANLASSVSKIEQAVSGGVAQTKKDIEAATTALGSNISGVLATSEQKLTSKVDEAKAQTDLAMKAEILNRENTIRTGEELNIRYRTYSGLSPVMDVYDSKNIQRIIKAPMTEVGVTGIYEAKVKFLSIWGKGDYTIICSESTYGTLDALIITVMKADVEQIYSQVSAVLGSTSGLSGLKSVTDNLSGQFSVIETALSKVGKDLVKEVRDAASSGTAMESLFVQLTSMAKEVKVLSSQAGLNTDTMLNLLSEKKQDLNYLRNKTQQLKAAMEINQKMIDNMANKPVTQTWYEYN